MRALGYNFLAIKELQSFAEFHMQNDDLSTLVWCEDESVVPRPSDAEILAKAEEIKIRINDQVYKNKRRYEYPAIADQLDDLFHQGAFSSDMMAKIQAVKDKYPKA
jgi:hypothetical protein